MATAAPLPQGNPPDPQVVTESSRTATNVDRATLIRNDPATAAAYTNYLTNAQRVLTEKYAAEGASLSSAREDAELDATLAANKQFAPQIIAAGAGTATTTTDPLLPQQPQPPSGPVTPVNPAANPQVPDVSLPEEQASPAAPAAPVDPAVNPQVPAVPAQQAVSIGDGGAAARAAQEQAARNNARAQAQLQAQKAQAASGDWRLKLRLAPGSDYLYNAGEPGILQPLKVTDGVIFPYTPAITTTYTAMYNNYELTHSNYKGYFYQGSSVGELNITATFTAQDSNEAAYLLAVIQFFKSVTKMFYGQQDAFRGSPPPLVFLQGYGDFQFNLNPCVVQTFNYNLPADVDYIRAGAPNINGTNLLQRRDRQTATVGTNNPSASRMSAAGLTPGGTRPPPPPTTLGRAQPTYVPTKMEMTLVLLPMQTRSQISRQFSMEKFANGSLVQRGFW
jgi:hypothetical protein